MVITYEQELEIVTQSSHLSDLDFMLAFKITINNEPPRILGIEDWVVFSINLTAIRNTIDGIPEFHNHCGGLTDEKHHGYVEHFRWRLPDIKTGDTLIIEVIESMDALPPTRRYRSDKERQESSFTEEEDKEIRYKEYLELKAEFEK